MFGRAGATIFNFSKEHFGRRRAFALAFFSAVARH